jgi:hypothetical protein
MARKGRTVAVRITADTKGLVAGVTRAEVNLSNLRKTAVAGTTVLAKLAATAAAAGAGALTALYARTAPLIDQNAKLADRLNISTEALAGMQLQAGLSGISNETLSKSLEKMIVNIGRAANEGGTYEKALERIGLKSDELRKMSADQQFNAVADAISGLGTASEQAAAAQDIFGRSGVEMLNLMREGSGAILDAQRRAEAYGLAISRVDAAKVEAANDAWDESQKAMEGIANRITVKLAPIVEALSGGFADAALESQGFGQTIDRVFNGAVKTVGFFADMIQGFRVVFKGAELVVFTFEAAIFEVFRAATHTVATSLEGWLGLFDVAIEKINKTFGKDFATFDFNAADSPFVKAVDELSNSSIAHIQELKDEMQALALQELPSEKIERFVANVQAASQKAAEAVAANRKAVFAGAEEDGASSALEEEYRKFQEMHMARETAEIESLSRSLEQLKKFHDAGLASTGQYWGQTTKLTIGTLTTLTASVANHSKKAFDLNKKLSIAQAVMNTYEMATGAYKALAGIPIVGPALGAAAAAAAIKFGQLQIQGIKSAQFGGGTAPSAQNTPAPATTPVGGGSSGGIGAAGAQQTVILEGVNPNSLFTGSQLIDIINMSVKDGKRLVLA